MSRAEVIDAVDAMGKEDRLYLSAYLKAKELSESAAFIQECDNRIAEMNDGKRISSKELQDLHAELEAKGL